jgi:uncharacterized membrane protein
MKMLDNTFVKWLTVTFSATLTLCLLFWLADTAESALATLFKLLYLDTWYIQGLGFALSLAIAFFIGLFFGSEAFATRLESFQKWMIRFPFIAKTYGFTPPPLADRKKNKNKWFWLKYLPTRIG